MWFGLANIDKQQSRVQPPQATRRQADFNTASVKSSALFYFVLLCNFSQGFAVSANGHSRNQAHRYYRGNIVTHIRLRSHNPTGYAAHFEELSEALKGEATLLVVQETHLTREGSATLENRSGRFHHAFGRPGVGKKYTVQARGGIGAHPGSHLITRHREE